MFLNSHLLDETERICDRIALIYEGQLRLHGTLDDLRCGDQFSIRFKPHERLKDIVTPAGFVSEEATSGVAERFSFAGNDANALSTALLEVLKNGIVVHEVVPKLKDLEMVLRETIAEAEST